MIILYRIIYFITKIKGGKLKKKNFFLPIQTQKVKIKGC